MRDDDSSSSICGGGGDATNAAAEEEERERRRGRSWRKRKREGGKGGGDEEGGGGSEGDPLMVFGQDVMTMIFKCLDARSVARSLAVSRGWNGVASRDVIWAPMCEELWKGKAHIPQFAKIRGVSRLVAYSFCVMDSRRTRIMQADLCDHVWEYRFKKIAPPYWLNLDPSWNGTGPPMRRYFHPNGSHTADPTDEVWGGHECTYSVVTSYVGGKISEHYVRINRWPQMTISRKPDWSWEMANNLYCYNSIPDPTKEEGTGPLFPVW